MAIGQPRLFINTLSCLSRKLTEARGAAALLLKCNPKLYLKQMLTNRNIVGLKNYDFLQQHLKWLAPLLSRIYLHTNIPMLENTKNKSIS